MSTENAARRQSGEAVVLRYVTSGGRIEICWPCRVVEDSNRLLALFIAAGSPYKADPKLSAAEKLRELRPRIPAGERVWRTDTLRLMFPNACHSVSLSWHPGTEPRALRKYFVNMEEPFRRTSVGFDTQDHTLDIELAPDLTFRWRDEDELASHVTAGLYSPGLARAVRGEAERVLERILRQEHECVRWCDWRPPADWTLPGFAAGWCTAPPTFWDRRAWAYGDSRD